LLLFPGFYVVSYIASFPIFYLATNCDYRGMINPGGIPELIINGVPTPIPIPAVSSPCGIFSGAITAIDRVPVFYFLFDLAIGLFVSYLLSCTTVALYGTLRQAKKK
jgi:hypothetical protein